MRRIFRYVLQGFGWEVGAQAARAALEEAADRLGEPAPPEKSARDLAREARLREKAERKRRGAEAREAKRRDKAVERELAALKKRIGDD